MEDLFGLEDDDDDIRANALGSDSILDTPSKNVEGFRDFVKSGGAQKRQANQDNLIGFKDFVKSEGENHRKQQANLALFNASSQNPDQAAKDLSIAQAENLPVEVIQSDRPFYTAQDQFNKSLNDSLDLPSTRSWLANNQEYAPLAQDTLAQLGLIEKSVRNLVGATVGLAGMSGASAGTSVAITSRVMERLPLPEFIDPLWEGLEYVGESLESGGDVVVDFSQDRIQSQDNKFDMTVAGFGQMLGQMGALKYSAKLAWPLMFAMGMYESRRLIEDDPDSAGSSQGIQDLEVILGGAETAITEMVSTYAQLKLFKVPAAMGVTNKLKANLITLAGGAASEGLQETMESMLRDYVHSTLSADDEYELEDSFGQSIKEGEIGSYVGLVTQLFLNGIRGTRARRDKKFFDDLNKASEDQPLKDRSQKAYESMAEAVTEHISQDNETGEPITEFHVNAETFKQTMAELDATPEQIELMFPGMTEQLDEAILENDDVTVPVANFVGRVAGSDVGNALSPHLRRDGNALSLTEQIAAEKEAGSFTDIITKGAEKIIADQKTTEEFKASANEVKNIIEGQLNAAGRFSKDVNKKYAEFVRDFYITQAQATGISPSEYYERYPYKVSDGSIPATSDADVLTQAKNAGYLGADPSEASEWLRAVAKGLDMSLEGRMERAREMGFDIDELRYHGTDAAFDSFDIKAERVNRAQNLEGIYTTNRKDSAEGYGDNLLTLLIKKGKVADGDVMPNQAMIDKYEELLIEEGSYTREESDGKGGFKINDWFYKEILPAYAETGRMKPNLPGSLKTEVLKAGGYTSAKDGPETVNFYANDVRSIDAAFDPDYADSSNLLAQARSKIADAKAMGFDVDNPVIRTDGFKVIDSYRGPTYFVTPDYAGDTDGIYHFTEQYAKALREGPQNLKGAEVDSTLSDKNYVIPEANSFFIRVKNTATVKDLQDAGWPEKTSVSHLTDEMIEALEAKGFDSAKGGIDNVYGDEIIVFDPKNIRSVDAMFDPSQSDSSNLLAQPAIRRKNKRLKPGKKKVTVKEVGEFFDELHLKKNGEVWSYDNPEHVRQVTNRLNAEFRYQMEEDVMGLGWYDEDFANTLELTMKIIPELRDNPPLQRLLSVVAAILSNGNKAKKNWEYAAESMVHFLDEGSFPLRNPDSGKVYGIRGQNISKHLDLLNKMVADLGVDQTSELMLQPHTIKELRVIKKKYGGGAIEGVQTDIRLGVVMFGEKIGPFMMNMNGIHEVTIDSWMTRQANRHFGKMVDHTGNESTGLTGAPKNAKERAVMKKMINAVAKRNKVTPQDAQAVLWYYEQQLFSSLGTNSTPEAFSDGAKTWINKREQEGKRRSESGEQLIRQANEDQNAEREGVFNQTARVQAQLSRASEIINIPGIGDVEFGIYDKAVEAAKSYAKKSGIEYQEVEERIPVSRERAEKIAREFDLMEHRPNDPDVAAAYDALIKETLAQFETVLETGLKIEFFTGEDPYPNTPREAILDVIEDNHLWVYPTEPSSFGNDGAFDDSNNPLLQETEFVIDGRVLLANDVFRITHDYFGHIKNGNGFRAGGEENAWQSHAGMYSPLARRALTTETRGQNSWANYGPHGDRNRTAKTEDTIFADQKIGLLPEWVSNEQRQTDKTRLERHRRLLGERLQGAIRADGRIDLAHFTNEEFDRTDPSRGGTGADRRSRFGIQNGTFFGVTSAVQNGYRFEEVTGRTAKFTSIAPESVYAVEDDYLELVQRFPAGNIDIDGTLDALVENGFSAVFLESPTHGKVIVARDPLQIEESRDITQQEMSGAAPIKSTMLEQGDVFNQTKVEQTDTAEFKEWAGTDQVIDSDEINSTDFSGEGPFVMKGFHATTHDVQEFDSSVKGNPDGQFGQVNYFTSSDYDAETNYLADGTDLTSRIESRTERLEQELEDSLGDDFYDLKTIARIDRIEEVTGTRISPIYVREISMAAEELAKKELVGDGSQVMEVYLKTEKPFVVSESPGGTPILELFNYETVNNASIEQAAEQSGIDDAVLRDLIEKGDSAGYRNATNEEQEALDLVESLRWEIQEQESEEVFQAIRDVAIRYDIDGAELLGDLYGKLSDELSDGSVEHGLLEGILRENKDLTGAYDYDNGESVGNNIIRDIIKELGYDSIILKDAEQRFSGMEMAQGTSHIHIFDANNTNIKSVDNAGTFDPANPNIYAQPGWHGTGNGIFDKFSLEAMGTGEGAQAYGWGMYFAGKRSIAEWYRDKLSGGQWDIFFNGKKLGSPSSIRNSFMMLLYKTPTNPDEFIAAQVGFIKSDPLVMDAISDGSATWSEVLHEEVGRALDMDGTKDFASEVHAKIDGFDVDSVEVKFKGELYEVNLPEDSELMVWDGMLKNMSAPVQEKIKAAILSIGAPPDGLVINLDGTVDPDISGRIVYEYISEHFRENAVFAYPALTDIGDDVWDETEKDTSLLLNKHGIPGLMYEDGTSRGNKKGTTSNYVIWDEEVVTIESVNDEKRQAELLEQNKRDAVRGTFDPSKLLTTLNEDADYTTFLHESAHFFLTVYADQAGQENAPLRTTEDMQTLLDWFGVKDLATWNSMSVDEQRKFHEQFAMSFEGYLMEGKAPSVKMQGLFDRFAAWLRNAYRSIKDLNEIFKKEFGYDMPIMTGEVRQVMDRMLASEDQITQAKEVQNMMPMYENQEDSDMDDEEWTDYKAAQQEADDAANMKLGQDNARQVKWLSNAKSKIIARMQSKVRGLRKEAREDIAAEVTSQPVYRAVQFFRRGEIVNEEGEIEKVEEHKLDSTAIKEFYEDTPVDEVPDLGNLKGMTKQGGIAPDVAAQLMNYPTVDEMIKDLTEAKPVKQEIDEQVDAFMLENHGELMDQKAIDAAVDSALHTEARSRLLSTELRHLAKSGQPVRVLTEAAKRSAQLRLEGKKFVDVRPKKYIAAEARSSKAVFNALQRGDTEGAIQAKREQLLNNQLAIESQKIVDEFEKGRVRANKSQKKSAQKKMRGEFLLQLNHLYGRFDLRKSVSLKEQTEERKPIADWITAETEKMAAAMPGLPGWILDDSLKKSYKQMNILEFRDLMDSVTQLETLARREENMYQAVRNQTYEQEISSILAEFEEANPDVFEEPGVPKRYRKDDKPYNERLRDNRWSGLDGELINVENLLDMMTGGKGKKVFESLFSRISKAQDNRNELMLKIGNMLNDVTNAYTLAERHNMSGSRSEKGWQTSTGRYVTRENRIMVGVYNGSVEGQQRLRDGNGYTEVEMEEIIDSLEEKDVNLIKKFWQISEEVIWPRLKAVDERTVGIAAPKVIATPYMTRFGEVGGGYAPLVYDGDMDVRVYELNNEKSVGDLLGGLVHTAATARSASHERLDAVDKHLDLRLTSMTSKLNETVHDVTHREAIADTYRLLQDDKVAQVIKTLSGPKVYRAITNRVRMVARKPHQPTGFLDTALWHIRKNTLIGMMGYSFNTVAINLLGVSPMIGKVGGGRYLRALAKITTTYFDEENGAYDDSEVKNAYNWVLEKSQYMRNRLASIDRDLNESVSTIASKGSFMPKMTMMFAPLGMMDRIVTMPGWIAGYELGLEKYDGDETAAVEFADRVVRGSQGAGRPWDLAQITSDDSALGGKFAKNFTMFYNFFSAQLGTMRVQSNIAGRQISDGDIARAAMTVAHSILYVIVIPSTLEALARGQCGDDPDAADYGYCAVRSSALFTGAFFPIIRSMVPAIIHDFDSDTMSFGVQLSPIESSLKTISSMPGAAFDIATGEPTKADWRNLLKGTGYITGLPSAQAWRSIDAYIQLMDGDSDDWTDLLTGVPYD